MADDVKKTVKPASIPRDKGLAAMGVISRPKHETLVQRLGRRIHNQRAMLRKMDTFWYGTSHLRTIKRLCWHLNHDRKLRAKLDKAVEGLLQNQIMLEAINHTNSTDFNEVRERIVANRTIIKELRP